MLLIFFLWSKQCDLWILFKSNLRFTDLIKNNNIIVVPNEKKMNIS